MQFQPEELIIKAEELKRMAARLIDQSDRLMEVQLRYFLTEWMSMASLLKARKV